MLYSLNIYNLICQLHVSKAWGKRTNITVYYSILAVATILLFYKNQFSKRENQESKKKKSKVMNCRFDEREN
jgi:hypothetical protein